jgi:hypothetical protein
MKMIRQQSGAFLTPLLLFSLFLLAFSSCSNEDTDDEATNYGSLRDYTYDGSRLSVTLDGQSLSNVKSAVVKSTLYRTEKGEPDPSIIINYSHIVYKSVVTLNGFPSAKMTTTLETLMYDNKEFDGETTVNHKTYIYHGEFTGNPMDSYSKQGLVIQFTSK